jgi:mycothiol synthase
MIIDLDPEIDRDIEVPHVPGIEIEACGPLTDEVARVVHRVIEETFEDEWGHSARTFEEWSELLLQRTDLDPSLWFLARAGDEVVAALVGHISEGLGWVGSLGVRKGWRRRGIGEALLKTSFREFRARGLERAGLGVDAENAAGAVGLYERAGMKAITSYRVFEKSY